MEFLRHPLVALLVGVLLNIFVPYLRKGLEEVALTGSFKNWPKFDWRYLAMFLIPVLEYGVAFLTIDGLWQQMLTWAWIYAVSLAYAGTDIGKEVTKLGMAVYTIAGKKRP